MQLPLLPAALKGPLGTHTNYIRHIALGNFMAYESLKKLHKESESSSVSAKYEEFRLFLNTVESTNNVLDYFYFEFESTLAARHPKVSKFRKYIHTKFPALQALANLANAYKHCVRLDPKQNNKITDLPWAKDLQRPGLSVTVDSATSESPRVDVEYTFEWPILEHDKVLKEALDFWVEHLRASRTTMLVNA